MDLRTQNLRSTLHLRALFSESSGLPLFHQSLESTEKNSVFSLRSAYCWLWFAVQVVDSGCSSEKHSKVICGVTNNLSQEQAGHGAAAGVGSPRRQGWLKRAGVAFEQGFGAPEKSKTFRGDSGMPCEPLYPTAGILSKRKRAVIASRVSSAWQSQPLTARLLHFVRNDMLLCRAHFLGRLSRGTSSMFCLFLAALH